MNSKYHFKFEELSMYQKALDFGDIVYTQINKFPKNKLGFYNVEVKKQDDLVALFKGVVYRTSAEWE